MMRILDYHVVFTEILLISEGKKKREALEYLEKALDYLPRMLEFVDSATKGGSSMCPSISASIERGPY
jgi:hypothetical protein